MRLKKVRYLLSGLLCGLLAMVGGVLGPVSGVAWAKGPTPTATSSQPGVPTPTSLLLIPTAIQWTTATPTAPATEEAVTASEPPQLTIDLPSGWQAAFQTVPIRTAFERGRMNVGVYRGPVKGGTGFIVVLWGFPQLASPSILQTPISDDPSKVLTQMLWADGLRLLQGAIVDITCNVGTAEQRNFRLGGTLSGVGAYFNVNGCQGEPDTAGWFIGINIYGRSYLFYAFVDPLEAYTEGRADLQTILDSIRFIPPATATPTASP
jgi:hypothetical protein